MSRFKRRLGVIAGIAAPLIALTGCAPAASQEAAPGSGNQTWEQIVAAAEGQTVNWYMWGGDERLNSYINEYVAGEAAEFGITINQVKITDTVDAVNKVLGEKQSGKTTGGSVDLVWVNGENFATGKQADIWLCGWAKSLPNAEYVDWESDAVKNDFGTPVDDCEAPWNQSMSVVVFNSEKASSEDFSSVGSLVEWAGANPGLFAYAAPPDFNGSMAVRRMFYDAAGGYDKLLGEFDQDTYDRVAPAAWAMLNDLEPDLWRGGQTYPQSVDEVQSLFATGEIAAYLSYDAGGVGSLVEDGVFPESTRQAVFADGMIGNTNYVAIPANAANSAAAQVVANILQDPEAQLIKADPSVLGYYPAILIDQTPVAAEYAALPSPESVLPFALQQTNANPELTAAWLAAIEKGWIENVLQK